MTARRSYEDETRARFLDFWERKESYGAPVGCLATTFTFDETFFELECLVGVETDPRESQVGYDVEREEESADDPAREGDEDGRRSGRGAECRDGGARAAVCRPDAGPPARDCQRIRGDEPVPRDGSWAESMSPGHGPEESRNSRANARHRRRTMRRFLGPDALVSSCLAGVHRS